MTETALGLVQPGSWRTWYSCTTPQRGVNLGTDDHHAARTARRHRSFLSAAGRSTDGSLTTKRFFPWALARYIAPSASRIRSDRKSTRLNSSHSSISYAVFCL